MTSPNTPVDVEALEAVARAALADKPHAQSWERRGGTLVKHANPWNAPVASANSEAFAEHIATFDPPTVLRLLAERREMLEALKRADGFVRRVARLSHSGDDGYTEPDDPAEDHYALDSLIAAAREIDIWPLRAILGAAILSALPEGKGE